MKYININNFLPKNENGNTKNEILKWVGIFLIILFLSAIIYFNNKNALKDIKEKRLYTVGIISGFSKSRSMEFINYIYSYNGKSFEGKAPRDINVFAIGDRALVVYNPNTNIKFLLPYFIDDSIKELYNGWSKPPMSNVTDSDVIKYLEENY